MNNLSKNFKALAMPLSCPPPVETSNSRGFRGFLKQHAFTLAETLITLTIIGVVAAMTIPTLMSKYQEKALESQFKKSYAILNQAVALSGRDYECYRCYNLSNGSFSDCKEFWDNVVAQLKVVKVEQDIPKYPYKNGSEILAAGGGPSTGICYLTPKNQSDKYYLADGSTFYIYMPSRHVSSAAASSNQMYSILDVNGDKGPNKWGYDVFFLTSYKSSNNSVKLIDFGCPVWEKGGKRITNILTGTEEIDENTTQIGRY